MHRCRSIKVILSLGPILEKIDFRADFIGGNLKIPSQYILNKSLGRLKFPLILQSSYRKIVRIYIPRMTSHFLGVFTKIVRNSSKISLNSVF